MENYFELAFSKYSAYFSQAWLNDTLMPLLMTSGLRIVFIISALYILHKITSKVIRKVLHRIVETDGAGGSKEENEKREETLARVMHAVIHVLLVIVGSMMVLSELGVNIAPLIAAAGIGGLAIGFGAQYLISDLINGAFLLIENQYRVGDVVCFGTTCGLVEDVSLRRTVLRDLKGAVHNVPNGQIKIASNLSNQYARIDLDIGVDYASDLDHVEEVVNRVCKELTEDAEWKDDIVKTPEFLRVNDFADSAIIIKILGETKPLKNWGVAGELRKRLKKAFDKEGIVIPFNQVVIHRAEEPKKEE